MSIINAASTSQADVSSAIASAANGDTVIIPAGSSTWSSGISTSKYLTIQGAGGGRVEGVSATSLAIGTGSKSFTVRSGSTITTFAVGETVRARVKYNATNWMEGTVMSWGSGTLMLNVTTTGGSGTFAAWVFEMPASTIITNDGTVSVLFDLTESTVGNLQLSGLRLLGGTSAQAQVTITIVGSGRPIILHDLRFSSGNVGSRNVRFGSGNRGLIYRAYFDAGFDWDNAANNNVPGYGIAIKHNSTVPAGDAVWIPAQTMGTADSDGTQNVYVEDCFFTGYTTEAMDPDDNARFVFRHSIMDNSGSASHGADTSNIGNRHLEYYNNLFIFDQLGTATANTNGPLVLRGGTGVFTNNTIDDYSSSEWGARSTISLYVENLRRNQGRYACWAGGYPAPHQVGQGGDGVSQILEPFYAWSNTGTVTIGIGDYSPDECSGGPAASTFVQLNRDYYNGTAMPGWAAYTYPHPLQASPAAPTGLRVVRQYP